MHETLKKDTLGWYRVGLVEEDKRKLKVVQYASYDWMYLGVVVPCLGH